MVQTSTFGTNTRKTSLLEDDVPKSQRKNEEEFVPSAENIVKGNEEEIYNEQLKCMLEQKRATEGIRLQQKLKDILDGLRSRYRVPYQATIQKNKSLYDMEWEARSINAYRTTTVTFKFFYILSIIIFGFFLQWLYFQIESPSRTKLANLADFGMIASFLIGLFPIKNLIYLPRPTKSVCDTCERIESFISKKELSKEDIIEMKKLKKHGYLLIFLSVLSKILNFVFILTVLYVSTNIDVSPHLLSAQSIYLFLFIVFTMVSISVAFIFKVLLFRMIIQNQYSPEIIRLFL